ncbi:MAG: hypothetical protein ACRC2K_04890 [Clostridium sp.]
MYNSFLAVGEIINRGWGNLKSSFKEVLMIALIFMGPVAILNVIVELSSKTVVEESIFGSYMNNGLDISTVSSFSLLSLLVWIVTTVCTAIGLGVVIYLIHERSHGNMISATEAIKDMTSKMGSVIGLNIIIGLIAIISALLFALAIIVITLITFGIGALLSIPLYFVALAIAIPWIEIYTSTLIINNTTIGEAISKTNNLFKNGGFWRNIGRFLSIGLISFLVLLVVSMFEIIPIFGVGIGTILTFLVSCFVVSSNNIIVENDLADYQENNFNQY